MLDLSPSILALSAADSRQMLTTFALRKARHSAARSATSSRFLHAADSIATSIGAATKVPGGVMPVSIRLLRPACFGSKAIRCRWVRKNQRRTVDRDAHPDRHCHRIFRTGFSARGRIPASVALDVADAANDDGCPAESESRRTNEKDADLKLAKFDHRQRVYLAQPD